MTPSFVFSCPHIDRSGGILVLVCPSVCLSQNFNLASKMHTHWRFLFQTWYATCDEFYILLNFEITGSKVKATEILAKFTRIQLCLKNALRCILLQLGMHVAWDEFNMLSKVKVTEVMAVGRALSLYYTNTSCLIFSSPHFYEAYKFRTIKKTRMKLYEIIKAMTGSELWEHLLPIMPFLVTNASF